MADQKTSVTGLIGWFASNHVAANLLMITIIIAGLASLFFNIKKETFPDMTPQEVDVTLSVRGATPEEIEKGVLIKIEEAVKGVDNIEEMQSSAFEGSGRVRITLKQGTDLDSALEEINRAVDTIATFPAESERPRIAPRSFWGNVINVQVAGDVDERTLKGLAETIRNEILLLPEVSLAELQGVRGSEISVEVSRDQLRKYNLTMSQVANVIRRWSVDLSGGSIRSDSGNIRVRAVGEAGTGSEYERIVVRSLPDGTQLYLGDIANITDGFTEVESYAFFNGKRSFGVRVLSRADENEIAIGEAVKEYVEQRQETLPETVELTAWADSTYYLKGRLYMMLKNIGLGAILVFVMLGLFLRPKIAGWVVLGLPVAFLGTFALLPMVDVTVNVMSLFAFILVIGIVVDDAIIIGESAYAETERKKQYNLENIVAGTKRVALPATVGVLTTIAAFAPLLNLSSRTAQIAAAIGWVVVFCLFFSLVESKLVLPSHLALMKSSHSGRARVSSFTDKWLKKFISGGYLPFLRGAVKYRYLTLSCFLFILIVTVGLTLGGIVRLSFSPQFDNDYIVANVELEDGAAESMLLDVIDHMLAALEETNEELKAQTGLEREFIENMFTWVNDGTQAQFQAEMTKSDDRPVTTDAIADIWREKVGEIAGVKDLSFRQSQGWGGAPISVGLSGTDLLSLDGAATELENYLKSMPGVIEVRRSDSAGPEEIKLSVSRAGEALGLTLRDLAVQVREAFYGTEAQRIQRGEDEIRVMVRYPRDERESIGNLENMWIRLPDGSEAPFHAVASYTMERGYPFIRRVDGRRTVSVYADVQADTTSALEVTRHIDQKYLPEMLSHFPGVTSALSGQSRAELSGFTQMVNRMGIALILIYVLMAVPLRSYLQPILIMSVIPFGVIGAVYGHMIMGMAVNSISFLGIVALSGVVVNDSLIMVDYVNKTRAEGMGIDEAIVTSGAARLRPILLTSLTTFFGLAPILLETSLQAQIVIPMATSLAFGILFATVITLVLVPCLYHILNDVKNIFGRGERQTPDSLAQPALAPASGG